MGIPPHDRVEIRAALTLLQKAADFAEDVGGPSWDFAVEIERLLDLGVTTCDLRWLLHKDLIAHGLETTAISNSSRSFELEIGPKFFQNSCFVLTERGMKLTNGLPDDEGVKSDESHIYTPRSVIHSDDPAERPSWDTERRELSLGNILVKQFKVPAPNQEIILTCFQEEGWPPKIDDPLPMHGEISPKRRLHDTINSLNRCQKQPLVRFMGDGLGTGVKWELVFCRTA